MRVAVYSRWIDTLGGGEQTLGAFAATLAQSADVELLTHDAPDWNRFEDTLGFDLSALPVRVLPHDPDHYRPVQDATRDYDLFVNCSYLDHVRAYAKRNVLQVFFPPEPPGTSGVQPPPGAPLRPGQRRLQALGGLYPLERDAGGVFAWTDGLGRFALDTAGTTPLTVTLRVGSGRPRGAPPARLEVLLDGVLLHTRVLPSRGTTTLHVDVPAALLHGGTAFLDLRSDTVDPGGRGGDPRSALGVRVEGAEAAEHVSGRPRPAAGLERWTDPRRYVDAVNSYDLLLANSHFTQRWIGRRYGRGSELLYPPVQVGQFAPGEKRQRIISVGRFFVEGHTKKQREMIDLFCRLCDDGLTGWDYHLVGGTAHDDRSAQYLQDCRDAAAGYPVVLHPDAPLRELVELYAGSALCWNATGYGEDPDREPDRFEHFGMTTVEAMASGCVPLAFARAGQPEVVEQHESGVLWETLDDLAAATLQLAADPARRTRLAEAAVVRSRAFTYERFQQQLARLLAGP